MILFLLIFAAKSAYYILIGYDVEIYKCDTRDDLIDRINSMDLSYQRLPSITIDEDLELDCNELPMFYYKVATLHRSNNFPTYSFQSNKTNGFATFTLDTSTSSEDNCPGFTFSNINVNFKGASLNTSKISINNNVSITSDPNFEFQTTISEIPLNDLPAFQNLSFCRLTILPEVKPFMEENFTYPDQLDVFLTLKYAEAYMFYIDIDQTTDVLFENNKMIIDIINKTSIIIHLPDIINYSNAFYFNIVGSELSFTISGDLNYTDMFPHYLYITQDAYISENINVTLNPGNYFSSEGTCFKTVMGENFSLSLVNSNLFWNNSNPISTLSLSFVKLYLNTELHVLSTFYYFNQDPIEGNLSIECDSVAIPYHLEPAEGCFLNISTRQITSYPADFRGDLYVTSLINRDVNVTNLHFIDNPLISLSNRYLINAVTIEGKARISPYVTGSVGTITPVICVEKIETVDIKDFTIESDYGDAFQAIVHDGCICVNKTKRSSQTLDARITSEDDNSWLNSYETYIKTITFTISTEKCLIDLSILSERTQPVIIIIKTNVESSIDIIINQEAADKIERLQIGNSQTRMNITWSDSIILNCELIIYNCCDFIQLFSEIDVSNLKSVTLKDFSQLTKIEPFSDQIDIIILETTATIKNFTFTSSGWRYWTNNLPDDEEVEIKGFHHPNILLKITSSNAFALSFFSRLLNIGLETSDPFPISISLDTTITVNLIDNENWESVHFYPLILVSGTITLNMCYEILPVDFDDTKFKNNLNRFNTRVLVINRTSNRFQSIISVNSDFNIQNNFEIRSFDSNTNMYFEVNKEAVIYGAVTLKHSDRIIVVFRDRLIIDNTGISRMWRESNSIYMVNSSLLYSPSFLDDIKIMWNCSNETRLKPSIIDNAINTNLFSFEFANVSHMNISDDFERFFNQPFLIANALTDISCDELISKISFVDDKMSFDYSNKVVPFEVICSDMIYSVNPITFNQEGYVGSDYPSHIGLFLNRTMISEDSNVKKSRDKKELDPGVIACIIIASITAVIIIVCLSVYLFNRRKHSISNLVDS